MPANTQPIFPGQPLSNPTSFVSADGTNLKSIFTAGSNGALIYAIRVYSTSASTKTIRVFHTDGTNDYQIGQVSVASNDYTEILSAGFPDLIDRCEGIILAANHGIKLALTSALSTGEMINVVVYGGNY